MNERIRIGLLIDSFELPAWVAAMIKKIAALSNVEIALVVVNVSPAKHTAPWSYPFYDAIDRLLYKSFPRADKPCNLRPDLENIPQVNIHAFNTEENELSPQDITTITSHRIDLLIKLGFEGLSGDILNLPKFGVWSLDLYKERPGALIPAAIQFFTGNDITASSVRMLSNDPAKEKILYQSFSMTDKRSLNRNRNKVYWKSLSFIPRLLSLLAENGEPWFWKYVERNNDNIDKVALPGSGISNTKILTTLVKKGFAEIAHRIKNIFHSDNWNLFYHFGTSEQLETTAGSFKKIPSPKSAFWADPHLLPVNDSTFIFFEEWDHKKKKGHISTFEFGNEHTAPEAVKVLEKPYHLSYPFVFEWNGVFYMIPETASNRTVELYQCKKFPGQWDFVMNLMENVHAVDTTLFHHDGKWWLFANIVENEGASALDEMFIFYADDFLTADWLPHKLNPVVSDTRNARPAGALFSIEKKIYRPSQCSDKIYGRCTNINEVITLTTDDFFEVNIGSLVPDDSKQQLGIHSYSKSGQLTVIDVLCRT